MKLQNHLLVLIWVFILFHFVLIILLIRLLFFLFNCTKFVLFAFFPGILILLCCFLFYPFFHFNIICLVLTNLQKNLIQKLLFPFLSKLTLQIKIIESVVLKVSINCVLKYELSILTNLLFLVCFCLWNVVLYLRTICLVGDFFLWFLEFFDDRFMWNYHCACLKCSLMIKFVDLFGA